MKQIKYSDHVGFDLFEHGVESVVYIRCMEHRAAPKINEAEAAGLGECGECIRQQCWKDLLGLIATAIRATPIRINGKEALCALEASVLANGIGTFGVPDKREADFETGSTEWPS
jgi:hypothetical protein